MTPAPDVESDRSRFGVNAWLFDELYARHAVDPTSVPAEWRALFEGNPPVDGDGRRGPSPAAEAPDGRLTPLSGGAAVLARRMEDSLAVPTATSVRTIPAKLLELNRALINRHLERVQGAGSRSRT